MCVSLFFTCVFSLVVSFNCFFKIFLLYSGFLAQKGCIFNYLCKHILKNKFIQEVLIRFREKGFINAQFAHLLILQADPRFLWNNYLLEPFIESKVRNVYKRLISGLFLLAFCKSKFLNASDLLICGIHGPG